MRIFKKEGREDSSKGIMMGRREDDTSSWHRGRFYNNIKLKRELKQRYVGRYLKRSQQTLGLGENEER